MRARVVAVTAAAADNDDVEAWLRAHRPTAEPDWGPLQDVWRTLRAFGYVMTRHRGGAIVVDGHRMRPDQVRRLADRLSAGAMRWQGNGRAA